MKCRYWCYNNSTVSFFPGVLTVGEMLRNESAFLADVQQHMNFSLVALHQLMDTAVPNNNLMVTQTHP